MSAVNSLQPPSGSGVEPRPYEPSMEEILASIRRIIADDQPLPSFREPEARAAVAPDRAAAVQPEMTAPPIDPEPAEHPHAGEPSRPVSSDHAFPEAHGQIAAPQFPMMPEGTVVSSQPVEPEAPEVAGLGSVEEAEPFSEPASTVHDHAYHEPPLDHAPPLRVSDVVSDDRGALFSEATDHSVTAAFNALAASRLADNSEELLGIARDMIRPLLKAWIDDNLPSMVERMVRAEIERVARGGR